MSFLSKLRRLFGGAKLDVSYKVASPNGRVVAIFALTRGEMGYEVHKDGKMIVRKSALGLELAEVRAFRRDLGLVRTHARSVNDKWETIVGQEKVILNRYNEMSFYMEEVNADKRLLTLRLRVFDDGVALRYEIPAQVQMKKMVVKNELTEFALNANDAAWWIPAYQPDRYEYNYTKLPLRDLADAVHTPLTVETTGGYFVSVHEAALYNYGSMNLRWQGHALVSEITPLMDGTRAHVELPFVTPWRTVAIADNAIDLTMNRMIWNLNDPPRGNFDWVKSTKFLGIWWAMFVGEWTWAPGDRHGATTEHTKEYIDACARLKIPALLVEGWNDGWEGDWLEAGEHNKFTVPTTDFDPKEVVRYAREKGVEMVAHHETVGFVDNYEQQLEDAYNFLHGLGIHYVKSGYAGSKMLIGGQREFHHSQVGVLHYQRALEMAARYGIMLDVHEPIKGTGIERTWPNLLTREGARGQEYEGGALSPSHACILPFTRLLAGGMDYTSGIFDVNNLTKRMATTLTRQIAYYVTIYSAMQMAADRPRFYEESYPDLFKFIRDVPTNWERTVPLLGAIGEYYVVARQGRDSGEWYVGGVTNEHGRRVEVYFDFLAPGVSYEVEVYRDSEDAHYRDHQFGYVVEKAVVRREDRIGIYMAAGGGFALRLKPTGFAA